MRVEDLTLHQVNEGMALQEGTSVPFRQERIFKAEYTGNQFWVGKFESRNELFIVKFSVFPGGSSREWDGYNLAFRHGVSTVFPVASVSKQSDPKQGMVTLYVDGDLLDEKATPDQIFRFGKELCKLHSINTQEFGYISQGKGQFTSVQAYFQFWLDRTLPYIEANPSAYIKFRELYDQSFGRIQTIVPRFLHRDPKLDNVITAESGIKLIDFEWWQGGDPVDDISVALYHWIRSNRSPDQFKILLNGYYDAKNQPNENEKSSLGLYLLITAARVINFCKKNNPNRMLEAYDDFEKIIKYLTADNISKL